LSIIIIKAILNRKNLSFTSILISSSILGNIFQIMTILNANEVRSVIEDNILILKNSFNYFLKSTISIFYYPTNSKLESEIFLQQSLVSFLYTHIYLLILLIISIIVFPLLIKGPYSDKLNSISIVIISLIAILIISSKTFGWPYRFLVLTSALISWIIINLLSLIQVKTIRNFLKKFFKKVLGRV
jgi:hypothetical protein